MPTKYTQAEMDRLALRAFRQKVPTAYDNVSESMFTFAFTSAGIQEEELLGKLQALIDRALANGEDYSADDYDQFIRDAQAVIRNTCGEGDLPPELQKLIQPARLKLIYQTNVRQAHGLAQWRVGMDKWHLSHYPAWKFVRTPGAKVKRIVHQKNENAIRLKTDWHFWADRMNARSLGGFEVPYAPFGFNSYMVLRPVSKQDALRAGISPLRLARQSNMNMNRSRFRNLLDKDWQAGHTGMALPQPVKEPPTKPTTPPKTPSNPTTDNLPTPTTKQPHRPRIMPKPNSHLPESTLARIRGYAKRYGSKDKITIEGGKVRIHYHQNPPDKRGHGKKRD